MPKSTGEHWMGTPEACEYLGIGMRTLYKLIHGGELRAYEVGRVIRVRVRKVDTDAFLEAHVIEPGTLGHLLPPVESDHESNPPPRGAGG